MADRISRGMPMAKSKETTPIKSSWQQTAPQRRRNNQRKAMCGGPGEVGVNPMELFMIFGWQSKGRFREPTRYSRECDNLPHCRADFLWYKFLVFSFLGVPLDGRRFSAGRLPLKTGHLVVGVCH